MDERFPEYDVKMFVAGVGVDDALAYRQTVEDYNDLIAEKILLSHEPIEGIDWAYNIHGHDHSKWTKPVNLASNVVNFQVFSLADIIKTGALNRVKSLHRDTIDTATARKSKKGKS